MKFAKICMTLSLAVSALFVNAGAHAEITSNKAPTYTDEPKRMFVVSDIGIDFGEDYANGFQSNFESIIKSCKADIEMSRIVVYDRDGPARAAQMHQFNPDAILFIMRNGGTQHQSAIISVIYDVKLWDVKTGKNVWRAEVHYDKGDYKVLKQHGEDLAKEMTDKLKEDQILRSCPSAN